MRCQGLITGIADRCRARAASGHATAPLPSSVVNSRRFMSPAALSWKAMQQRVCVLHTHAISAAVGFNDSQFLSVRAPADDSASMTDGGSGHAAASDHCPTRAASEANLCDHAIRLRNRHRRYCLRRSCYGYDKASSSNQPDHSYPPFFPVGSFNLAVGGSKQRVCLGTLSFS